MRERDLSNTSGNPFIHWKAYNRDVNTPHKSGSVFLVISLEMKPRNLIHIQFSPSFPIWKVAWLVNINFFTPTSKLCLFSQLMQHLQAIQKTPAKTEKTLQQCQTGRPLDFLPIIPPPYQSGNNWLKHGIHLLRKNCWTLPWELFYTVLPIAGLPNRNQGSGLALHCPWSSLLHWRAKLAFHSCHFPLLHRNKERGSAHQHKCLLLKMCDSR